MEAKRLLTGIPRTFLMPMLAAALAFGMVLTSCDNETTSGSNVPGSTLAEKLDWVRVNAKTGGVYLIDVSADESIAPNQRLEYLGRSNITITLRGNDGNHTINLANNGNMFVVSTSVTLILDNITLRGRPFNTSPMIIVSSGGGLRMNNGTVIKGNTATNNNGGGVWVEGTFTMNAGTISGNNANNAGGGVAVVGKGTFIMRGGTISSNNARSGGGGVAVEYGNFTMSGGTISGNISENNGGGVLATNARTSSTSGIGNFIMNSGTISGNTARDSGGGVAASNEGTFILYNGSITGNAGNQGGGVSVALSSTFTMSGGTISGNTAKDSGGGVFVWGAFTKTGGTITGYESDRRNGNVVSNSLGVADSEKGHAAYAYYSGSRVTKRKETTAGSGVNLAYTGRNGSFSGGWDF
jgi:hypothetical protein